MFTIKRAPKRASFLALVFSTALLCAGCGGDDDNSSSSSTDSNADIRLANATASAVLNLNAAGTSDTAKTYSISAVATGNVSGYQSVTSQTYTVGISAAGSSLLAATQSIGFSSGVDYTLLAYERDGAINVFTLTDNQSSPASGFASLAIANAADAGTLDVYLVAPNAALNGVSPAFANVTAKIVSIARSFTADTYDIVVTAAGRPGDVKLTIPSVALASSNILTLALTSTRGGGLVNGALIHQGGAMQPYPTTKARVRVVGAFPATGATNSIVLATIGGAALPTLTAPSAGTYKLVNGNTSAYSVTVDGVAVSGLPAVTFANGGDYTIFAFGPATAPNVAVFADNNLPSSGGAANMRLVNGAVSSGGITLNVDYLPINTDVQYGTASSYSAATPSSTSLLQITSPVAAFPTYTASDVAIAGSGVYTIFVLGSTTAPTVVFGKDR